MDDSDNWKGVKLFFSIIFDKWNNIQYCDELLEQVSSEITLLISEN